MSDYYAVADLTDGTVAARLGTFQQLSPDGRLIVLAGPTERPEWLKRILPLKNGDTTVTVTDWRTGVAQARFRNISNLEFAPKNTALAVLRADGVVEGYPWPMRPPWATIALSMLVAAVGVWGGAWLWTRWRSYRDKQAAAREGEAPAEPIAPAP
jgi:hypothetical protein